MARENATLQPVDMSLLVRCFKCKIVTTLGDLWHEQVDDTLVCLECLEENKTERFS